MEGTHAVVGWPSRSSPPDRIAPVGDGARTSSAPRASRRSGRSQCSCHHRIESGSRRQTPGPCSPCTARQASHGAHPWRHWGGWGGGHPCKRNRIRLGSIEFGVNHSNVFTMALPPLVCLSNWHSNESSATREIVHPSISHNHLMLSSIPSLPCPFRQISLIASAR